MDKLVDSIAVRLQQRMGSPSPSLHRIRSPRTNLNFDNDVNGEPLAQLGPAVQRQLFRSNSVADLAPAVHRQLSNSGGEMTPAVHRKLSNSAGKMNIEEAVDKENKCEGNFQNLALLQDFAASYEGICPILRRSKRKLYEEQDKEVVNDPVLIRLDPLFLAPFCSPIYRRQFKKNGDTKSLKKNAELVFEDFKNIIRPTIRSLVGKSNSSDKFLCHRYFWCAYDIVRKRRANHIQAWRKNFMPSPFYYGGQHLYEAAFGEIKADFEERRKDYMSMKQQLEQAQLKVREDSQVAAASEVVREDSQVAAASEVVREDSQVAVAAASEEDDFSPPDVNREGSIDGMFSDDDADTLPYSDPFSDQQCAELRCVTHDCQRCGNEFDWSNAFAPNQRPKKYCDKCEKILGDNCTCVTCGEKLNPSTAFPKGNMEWCDIGDEEKSWCAPCYGQYVREHMIPATNERLSAQKPTRKRKAAEEDAQNPRAVKKFKKEPCKWCGAFTHKTKRSRLCPHNTKYQTIGAPVITKPVNDAKVEEEEDTISARMDAIVKNTPCKWCGAFTHKTKRSRLCPQNPKNVVSSPPSTPVKDPVAKPKTKPQSRSPPPSPPPALTTHKTKRFAGKTPRFPVPSTPVKDSDDDASAMFSSDLDSEFEDSEFEDGDSDFFFGKEPVPLSQPPPVGEPITPDCEGLAGYFEPPVPTPPLPSRQRFETYTNVNAKYERSRLLAHVIDYQDGNYTVYFLFNSEIVKGLQESDLSEYDGTYITRGEMLGNEFFDEGDEKVSPGRFRVEEVMHKENEYKCIRLTGSKSEDIGKLSNYDIAAVIKAYETQKQEARERGDVEILAYRTRSRKL